MSCEAGQRDVKANRAFGRNILRWYDYSRRVLPWRAQRGENANIYHVWLSEIMLQQTTVKAVIPYFHNFITRWPELKDLAEAEQEDVLRQWAGLGYYARARNMHKCAQYVMAECGGEFPDDEQGLLKLPGIGPYTAAAITAIGFGKRAIVVDGNVERVIARQFAIDKPLAQSKDIIKNFAKELTPKTRAGDYAQAMMDLGATICTPKQASCLLCPVQKGCEAHLRGQAAQFPVPAIKKAKPTRYGAAFMVLRDDEKVLLRQRPERGLLARMMEVPGSDWSERRHKQTDWFQSAPIESEWQRVPLIVKHTFTHFHLEIIVYVARAAKTIELLAQADEARCRWVARRALEDEALPSVMRKILARGFESKLGAPREIA